jgi:hypothetical protein
MGDGGKGDTPRPFSVSHQEFANNFDRIFGKKKPQDKQQPTEKENNGNGSLDRNVQTENDK